MTDNTEPKDPARIFLRIKFGLGDNIQFRIVVAHIRKKYPGAFIRVESPEGCQCIYEGLADESEVVSYPYKPWGFDLAKYVVFPPSEYSSDYCPSSKPCHYLAEELAITPEPELFRYAVAISEEKQQAVDEWIAQLENPRIVLFHYEGDSRPEQKNLDHRTIQMSCQKVREAGLLPVILDWSGKNPLVEAGEQSTSELWDGEPFADAGKLAALIQRACLFVGIDSGPGHVAGATDTPTVIVWTGFHPVQNYDLADNVTHFIPWGHEEKYKHEWEQQYFEEAYNYEVYSYLNNDLPDLVARLLEE